ncbi:MAG: hypothetical protein ACRBFS_22035 [Aureispira sp.]
MEGNIMGFIFFPLLILTTGALGLYHLFDHLQLSKQTILFTVWGFVAWTVLTRCMQRKNKIVGFLLFFLFIMLSLAIVTTEKATYAVLDFPLLTDYFGFTFLLHAFAPFYLLLLLHNKEEEVSEEIQPWVSLLASLFTQGFFFGINWIIIWLFGSQSLTFSAFFGKGQTALYYLPMLAGFLYWLLALLDQDVRKQSPIVLQTFLYLAGGSILIEGFFYVQLIWSYF